MGPAFQLVVLHISHMQNKSGVQNIKLWKIKPLNTLIQGNKMLQTQLKLTHMDVGIGETTKARVSYSF